MGGCVCYVCLCVYSDKSLLLNCLLFLLFVISLFSVDQLPPNIGPNYFSIVPVGYDG